MGRNPALKHRSWLAEAGEVAAGCRTAKHEQAEQAGVETRGDEAWQ